MEAFKANPFEIIECGFAVSEGDPSFGFLSMKSQTGGTDASDDDPIGHCYRTRLSDPPRTDCYRLGGKQVSDFYVAIE